MDETRLVADIFRLKKEKKAVILAHNYQPPEIQDIADFCGDSLELSRIAADTDADMVCFCGVKFMAETAKILSPDKKVVIPINDAGCFLADSITAEDVKRLRGQYPDAVFVAYVNTSAEVKANVDYCCTSANALQVVNAIPKERQIVFLPDRNLGEYVKWKTGRQNIVVWDKGMCNVHEEISADALRRKKELYPDALFLAHPECRLDVLEECDEVVSTSGMLRVVKERRDKQAFVVATEVGMLYRLKKDFPDRTFIPADEEAVCFSMKLIKLEDVAKSLELERYAIGLSDEIVEKAKGAIERMVKII